MILSFAFCDKGALARESACLGSFLDGHVLVEQRIHGMLQPDLQKILPKRHAGCFAEQCAQIDRGQTEQLCDLDLGDLLPKMLLKILLCQLDMARPRLFFIDHSVGVLVLALDEQHMKELRDERILPQVRKLRLVRRPRKLPEKIVDLLLRPAAADDFERAAV